MSKNVIEGIVGWAKERGIHELEPNRVGFLRNIVEELYEGYNLPDPRESARTVADAYIPRPVDELDYIDSLADIVVFSLTEMLKYNHAPELVLQECLSEISSRVGAYSDDEKKWLKDKSPEAQANWVQADYSKSKVDW